VALLHRRLEWLAAEREPTAHEQQVTLRLPFDQMILPAVGWAGAALVFGALNLRYSGELGFRVGITILMGGLTTCALFYLLGERSLRDVAARALGSGPPLQPVAPGVVARAVIAWTLATAVPVGGIAFVAFGVIRGDTPAGRSTAWSIIFLAVATIAIGVATTVMAARAVAEPIRSVRAGLARIEEGDVDVDVPVYDASEVGLLQAGFNRMAEGLRERERIRDLFGRQVGEDVARAALREGTRLGGEEREVGALFVDIVGSTSMALAMPPTEVVRVLNHFFRVVVEAVEAEGGLVNKFEGDAALCVFGAPVPSKDPAGDALRAARRLAAHLAGEVPEIDFGIGISAGIAVAGNVGAEHRFEYAVIGDPVNEAARLSELARQRPERVLASEVALSKAAEGERASWSVTDSAVLRGRNAATGVAHPVV